MVNNEIIYYCDVDLVIVDNSGATLFFCSSVLTSHLNIDVSNSVGIPQLGFSFGVGVDSCKSATTTSPKAAAK